MLTEFRRPDLIHFLAAVLVGCPSCTEPESLALIPGMYQLVEVNGKAPGAIVDSQPYSGGTRWFRVPDGALIIESEYAGSLGLTYQALEFFPGLADTNRRIVSFAGARAALSRSGDTLVITYSSIQADICSEFTTGLIPFTDSATFTRQTIELRRRPLICLSALVLRFRRQ